MITLTILLGVIAMLAAYYAGLTERWIGTGAVTSIILLLTISGYAPVHFLFDTPDGWALTLLIWAVTTIFYHRLLTDERRSTTALRRSTTATRRRAPMVDVRRRLAIWQFGQRRLVVAVAWGNS
jgi:hypothetical protein